ncbi:MAG: response regulator transcription factor [Rhodanobacteraceae bacterium]|nr:response regulator transcription factor [Rhodanobacteraceae bacterium]
MSVPVLVADDEPLLREALALQLAEAWPEAQVVASARNGREALELFERHQPAVCFLDVKMPGLSGIDVARRIGARAHLVFVTAYDRYAVEAFAAGVLDYLVKPVARERLATTVARLRERLAGHVASAATEALLAQLAARLERPASSTLRWIRSTVGSTTRLIAVDDIDYLRSEEKYTLIGWRGDDGRPAEAIVRTPLKELLAQLDPAEFVQVHRAAAVRLGAIDHLVRHDNETATIHLKRGPQTLPVSRSFMGQFRQM